MRLSVHSFFFDDVGDLTKEAEVLDWLVTQTKSDDIEGVTERVLHDMIKSHHGLAVLFCKFVYFYFLLYK